jgi:pimeloyl-ACP methyl ester carboxylesterase
MWRVRLVGLLTIVVLGCAHSDVPKPAIGNAVQSAVILVPGYYGTRLVRELDGKLVWISAAQAIAGDLPLTLPIPGLGLHDAIPLQPAGILEKVPIIPLLYAVDGYGSMLEALQEYGKDRRATIVAFSYDWRDDLMVSARKLDAVIHDLHTAGATDIRIVAHSMGGLMTAYYLRYGTQDPEQAVETWAGAAQVTGVTLVGVPFKGTMIAFRNSQYGVTIGLNRTLLQPTAVASFPATYYLLPAMDTDVLLTRDLQPMTGAVRDGNNWTAYRWGLLKPSPLPKEVGVHREAYTSHWLARSKRFSSLVLKPMTAYNGPSIPLLSISGRGQATLATGIWDRSQPAGTTTVIFDERMLKKAAPHADPAVLFKDGDGTVTTESAALPPAYAKAFRVTHHQYDVGHVDLMTAPAIRDDIIAFLSTR